MFWDGSVTVLKLLPILSLLPLARGQQCNGSISAPIALPVQNITLTGSHTRRGLEIQIGTPPQPFALTVSGWFNSTYIYDQNGQCTSKTAITCEMEDGGAFDEAASSSWNTSSGVAGVISLDPNWPSISNNWLGGTDTVTINSSFSIPDLTIGIPQASVINSSVLGLGKDSSLLTSLQKMGAIASRSFSLYWGQTGTSPQYQSDGSVVLGGYDEAIASGNNYTTELSYASPCSSGMLLSATAMVLQFPNGSSVSLLTNGQNVDFCIMPDLPTISIYQSLWQQWMAAFPSDVTNGTDNIATWWPNYNGLVFPANNSFPGDLTFTFDNQFDITVPNEQLVQYYYEYDSQGNYLVDDTNRELMITPFTPSSDSDIPVLGLPFLQAAMIYVNYDNNELSMWQANTTAQTPSLVGVGQATTGCAFTSTGFPNEKNSASGGSLTAGAIAGIVVGSLVFIAVVAAAIFWFLRRRCQQRRIENSVGTSYESDWPKSELDDSGSPGKRDLAQLDTNGVRSEMADESTLSNSPYPVEKSTDSVVHEMAAE